MLCHSLFCFQSLPASRSFPMSWLFASGQSIGASVLVLPMNIQGWFPLVLTSLISFLSKGLSRVFSSTIIQKYQFFGTQPSLWSQLSHPYMTIGKTVTLSTWAFVGKVMSLLFNIPPRFVIAFLPRSKCLFNFRAAATIHSYFVAQKKQSLSLFPLFPHLLAMKWWDQMPWSSFF